MVPSSSCYPDATGVLDAQLVSDDIGQVKHDIEVQIHDLEGDHCRRLGEAAEQVSDRLKANENDNPWPLKTGTTDAVDCPGRRAARACLPGLFRRHALWRPIPPHRIAMSLQSPQRGPEKRGFALPCVDRDV